MGIFKGRIVTEWLGDGRQMRLLEDFSYVDSSQRLWVAPADSIVDGASIPKAIWSIAGSPFCGLYRNASVLHDVYCVNRVLPWQLVHKMFYDAMLDTGVDEKTAYEMYTAVKHFGPRWDEGGNDIAFDYSVYDDFSDA